jgi:hypothetical protein
MWHHGVIFDVNKGISQSSAGLGKHLETECIGIAGKVSISTAIEIRGSIMTASFANIKDRVREAGTRIDITLGGGRYDCKDEDDERKVRVPR